MLRKIRRNYIVVTLSYVIAVAVTAVVLHITVFEAAAAFRGNDTSIGGEIFLVPFFLISSCIFYHGVIYWHYENKINSFVCALKAAKKSNYAGYVYIQKPWTNGIYGKYITDGKGHVVYRKISREEREELDF